MGDLTLGVILWYMVSASFSCFLQLAKIICTDEIKCQIHIAMVMVLIRERLHVRSGNGGTALAYTQLSLPMHA